MNQTDDFQALFAGMAVGVRACANSAFMLRHPSFCFSEILFGPFSIGGKLPLKLFRGRIVPLDGVMQGPAYFEARGPLDPAWRQSDSIWALAEPEELASALAKVAALQRDGTLEAYLAAQDALRPSHGQFTFFNAVKP